MLAAAEALLEKTVERLGTGEPIDTHEKLRTSSKLWICCKNV